MRRQRAENSKWRRGLAELCGYLPRGMYGFWSFLVGIRRHRGGIETYKPRLREIAT